MQNANSPRQWQPDDVDGHGSAHSYPSQHSLRSLEVHQPLAPPTSYQLPALSTSTAGRLHPAFPLSSDNINARALWADWIATEQYTSHEMVPQPTTAASSTSDASPRDSSDHRNQFTSEAVTGRYSATPLERSMQEREALGPGWVPFPPPVGQCTSSSDRPLLQCKWVGCRSITSFRREADLIRHLKTVHISPRAYACTESNCGMSFGRRDHLRAHQRNRHGC